MKTESGFNQLINVIKCELNKYFCLFAFTQDTIIRVFLKFAGNMQINMRKYQIKLSKTENKSRFLKKLMICK